MGVFRKRLSAAGAETLAHAWGEQGIARVDRAPSAPETKPVWRACSIAAAATTMNLGLQKDSPFASDREEFLGATGEAVHHRCHLAIGQLFASTSAGLTVQQIAAFSSDLIVAVEADRGDTEAMAVYRDRAERKAAGTPHGDPDLFLAQWVMGPCVAPRQLDIAEGLKVRALLSGGVAVARDVLNDTPDIHY